MHKINPIVSKNFSRKSLVKITFRIKHIMYYLKLALRIIHVFCGAFIIGNAITQFIWGRQEMSKYALFSSLSGILLLISGVANLIFLKTS